MKNRVVIGVIIISGFLFSCTSEDDQDMSVYNQNTEFATGGEDEQTPPIPPVIIDPKPETNPE